MSTLDAYLSKYRIRQASFAARVGTSQATISKLISRTVLPSLELAVRIERETDGEVSAASWVEVSPIDPEKDVA